MHLPFLKNYIIAMFAGFERVANMYRNFYLWSRSAIPYNLLMVLTNAFTCGRTT